MCAINVVSYDDSRMELVSYLMEKGADVNKASVSHFPPDALPSPPSSPLSALHVLHWVGWLVGRSDFPSGCL
jgi:hypothetical protein